MEDSVGNNGRFIEKHGGFHGKFRKRIAEKIEMIWGQCGYPNDTSSLIYRGLLLGVLLFGIMHPWLVKGIVYDWVYQ